MTPSAFRFLDPGILENSIEQSSSHILLCVNRNSYDASRDGIPELPVTAFSCPELFEAVLLQHANELGPRHNVNLQTKRWVTSRRPGVVFVPGARSRKASSTECGTSNSLGACPLRTAQGPRAALRKSQSQTPNPK